MLINIEFGFDFQPNELLVLFNLMFISSIIVLTPMFFQKKIESKNLLSKFIISIILVLVIGTLSLLNFSLAFLISLLYVPIFCLAISKSGNNLIFKILRSLILLISYPAIYFSILCLLYQVYFSRIEFNDLNEIYNFIGDKFYNFTVLSHIADTWTLSIVNLTLIPIWCLLWFISFS